MWGVLLTRGREMESTFAKNAAVLFIATFIAVVTLEYGLRYAVKRGWIEVDLNNMNGFWADLNPDFGVWHRSNATFIHKDSCFEVTYTTNSYGALDKERSLRSTEPRVVVLGDSMMEGYTLERSDRLSDLLEQKTGVAFLNFATSQVFGPVQYLLAYETLASKFDHEAILVGFLPGNDFTESSWEIGRKIWYKRYRPYFVGEDGHYELIYFNRDAFNAPRGTNDWLHKPFQYVWDNTSTMRTLRRAYLLLKYQIIVKNKIARAAGTLNSKFISYYFDYDEEDFALVRFILERLMKSAGKRTLILVTIPVMGDLLSLRDRGQPPLPARFEQLSKELGFIYVDLLPTFAADPGNWERYYHTCERHWTREANAIAAGVLAPVFSKILKIHDQR
jgi:hypothetical protein